MCYSYDMYNIPLVCIFFKSFMFFFSPGVFFHPRVFLAYCGLDLWRRVNVKTATTTTTTTTFICQERTQGLFYLIPLSPSFVFHFGRTFQGVVCLMQLSTRERDYIVDPLKLRKEMGRLLPVFTNPSIVKVGAWRLR